MVKSGASINFIEPVSTVRKWADSVVQESFVWKPQKLPVYKKPIPYIIPPAGGYSNLFYSHNHVPSVTWCDNGDLLCLWFSTVEESGREMLILASRLRASSDTWDEADVFYKVPGRNMSCGALLHYKNLLYHFQGVGYKDTEEKLVLVYRLSSDNGASWSAMEIITPFYHSNKPMGTPKVLPDGGIIVPCDVYVKEGEKKGMGSELFQSDNDGNNFKKRTKYWKDNENFLKEGKSAGWIAGVHGQVEILKDGSYYALGRSKCLFGPYEIDSMMPLSISSDGGYNFTYFKSWFPPIGLCQRSAILKLSEGPLVVFSYTDPSYRKPETGLDLTDAKGNVIRGFGLFAALSFDEGKIFPVRKLIGNSDTKQKVFPLDRNSETTDRTHAPRSGYLQAIQSPDCIIHLVSSYYHYRFNLAWLLEPHDYF
jgi:hypothetical protein